ncbi:MAG: hypothetical protein ACRDBP_17970 [Luteolibacter sp.]
MRHLTPFKTLQKRLMHYNKIKVSIARELTGVIWEIGYKMQSTPTPDAK